MSSRESSLTRASYNRIVARLSQQPHFTLIGQSWDALLEVISTSIYSPARNPNLCPQVSVLGAVGVTYSQSCVQEVEVGWNLIIGIRTREKQ
jgi:hypothetical protein